MAYRAGSAFLQVVPSLRGFHQQIARETRGVRVPISVVVDDRGLAGLGRQLAAVSRNVTARVGVEADDRDLNVLDRMLGRIDGRKVTARADVDVVGAVRDVAALAWQINQFADRRYHFRVEADTVGAVASVAKLIALVGTLGGLSGAAGGLAGGLLAIAPAGAAAVAGLLPVVSAFAGVGTAYKALTTQQTKAATEGVDSAKKAAAAAASVASAQRRAAQASADSARARRDGEREVADAVEQGAERVGQALDDQRRAQAALRAANGDLRRAQEDLTGAWEEGRRALEDLQDQADQTGLDQEEAALDLRDALEALNEAQSSGDAREIERADLAYRRQLETVDQLAKRGERVRAENAAGQAAGIAGTEQYTTAVAEVSAAEARAAEARAASGAADLAVLTARREADESVARARESAAERIAAADSAAVEAAQALRLAQMQAADSASSTADAVTQAFADLGPAQAAFARYLFGLKPLLDDLSNTAASRFFPALTGGLDALVAQAPAILGIVGNLAGGMGAGAELVLRTLASPVWINFFTLLGDASGYLIPALVDTLFRFADVARLLLEQMLPLAPAGFDLLNQFAGLLGILLPFVGVLLTGLIPAASMFLTALEPLGPVIAALGPILAVLAEALAVVLVAVLQALAPLLVALTPLIAAFAMEWANGLATALTTATPLLVQVAEFLSRNADAIVWLVSVVGGVAAAFQPLLWVLGLVVSFLHGWVILRVAGAALAFFGLQGTLAATIVTRLLSPISLLRLALPFLGTAIAFVGKMILRALGPFGILLTVLSFLYTSNEQFRNAVNLVLGTLGQLVGLLISSLQPAFEQVLAAIAPLIPMLLGALMPILMLLVGIFVDLVTTVLPPLVAFFVRELLPVIVTLSKILATVLVWVITNVVVPAIQFFAWLISNVVGPAVLWLYENVVKPAFNAIGALIGWVWANVIKPNLDFFVFVLTQILGPAINWLWLNIVKPGFTALGQLIAWVWENIIRPALGALWEGLQFLGRGFESTVRWIGDIWNGLRNLLAIPINFLIETVFNNGIRKAWNLVADLLPGVDPIGTLDKIPTYAKGGPVTRDTVLRAGEAGPEYILSAPAVRAFGGLGAVDEFHRDLTGRAGGRPAAPEQDRAEIGGPPSGAGRADSGGWRRLWDIVRGQFPTARMTSGYRPGDRGFHGKGMAVDIAGPTPNNAAFMKTVNRWIATSYPTASELIYTPGINIKDGRPHTYNAATRADHFDHVHWAMASGAGEAAKGGGYNWFEQRVVDLINGTTQPIIDAIPFRAPPAFMGIPRDAATTFRDSIRTFLVGEGQKEDAVSAGGGGAGGAGVARWRGLVEQALGIVGQPLVHTDRTLRRMNQESGGNPRAINLWDSNARKGIPSKGLMQVIDPTFAAHRDRTLPNDVYDPLANVVASMRYALSRYSGLPAAYDRAGGYDSGGWLEPGLTAAFNGTARPEAILTADQWDAVSALAHRGGGGELRGELYLDSGEFLGVVHGVVADDLADAGTALTHGRRD